MKPFSITNYVILFLILIGLGILYKKFEDKRINEENKDNYEAIQKYLLDDVTLAKSKKPILWIHVPYEYNSRKWLSFGSRSSFELNQPYLYLTVKSIIQQCDNSFTICIIDDNAFKRLIPGWSINMNTISDPILNNMRKLGLMKLIHIYGGLLCPISFLCIKDLIGMYQKGIAGDKMFGCETIDRNITSTTFDYYPSISFCGAPKDCQMVGELIDFMQRTISHDYTSASIFLGEFDRYIEKRVQKQKINIVSGSEIGTKTIEGKPIILDDLMADNYIHFYPNLYGILIPSDEILKRRKYEWFSRMSAKQVLESNTILGNYMLLVSAEGGNNILEPLQPSINKEVKNKFVGFWRVPSGAPNYGVKPNFLGDNITKQQYPGR
uniref:Uncharacterized protein n=1 Tax=viral metagenome TaxID=1070528 RepID=A0A6C0ES31_9ZZZZ